VIRPEFMPQQTTRTFQGPSEPSPAGLTEATSFHRKTGGFSRHNAKIRRFRLDPPKFLVLILFSWRQGDSASR
jgi:hypothetical protein